MNINIGGGWGGGGLMLGRGDYSPKIQVAKHLSGFGYQEAVIMVFGTLDPILSTIGSRKLSFSTDPKP